jgi:hypothetical protein
VLPVTEDMETVALRPMIVDGQVQADDYEVIWRGLLVGRIMKQPDSPHWWWCCNLYGQPPTANDRGPAINFKDSQLRFKLAWTRIRAALTAEDIAVATRHAEAQRPPSPVEEPKVQQALLARENERAPRQRVLKAATMEFDGGTMDCLVRNVSETGAALEVAASLDIPAEFDLLISGHTTSHRCQVKWRKENRIGVAFK